MASLYEISAHYRRDVCVLCAAGALSSVVLRSSLGTYIRREVHKFNLILSITIVGLLKIFDFNHHIYILIIGRQCKKFHSNNRYIYAGSL
jgi:hypothetical protein